MQPQRVIAAALATNSFEYFMVFPWKVDEVTAGRFASDTSHVQWPGLSAG
jgi:hypothetical protein